MIRILVCTLLIQIVFTSSAGSAMSDDVITDISQLLSIPANELTREFEISPLLARRLERNLRQFGEMQAATPLVIAIGSGQLLDAAFLIGRGAPVNNDLQPTVSPIWALTLSSEGEPFSRGRLAELLISRGAKLNVPRPTGDFDSKVTYPIDVAITRCDLQLTKVLLENGAIPSAIIVENLKYRLVNHDEMIENITREGSSKVSEIFQLLLKHGQVHGLNSP